MPVKSGLTAWNVCAAPLVFLILALIGCNSSGSSTTPQPKDAITEPPEPQIVDAPATLARIHDVFLKNYQPIPYALDHPGQYPKDSIGQFIKDPSDTGFTTTSFADCASCYSFVINFEVTDLSGHTVSVQCAPTINLNNGSVIEWNADCPRFFRPTNPLIPTRVRPTAFFGLQGDAKNQMDEYMLLAQGSGPPDPPWE